MCVGWQLSNRELYTIFLRLICAFEMVPARDITDAPILDAIGCNAVQSGLSIKPKEFKIKLRARDGAALGEWIKGSEERTKDLW
jgi:phenylacetate 2-hydroxylase